MTTRIVHSFNPITLIGGGEASRADVDAARALAPTCVAADGGADFARRHNVLLEAAVGDFDSISAETLSALPDAARIHVAEQDSTDFEKALRHIAAPAVVAVGFTGGRIDHQLAVLHVLVACADTPCVVLGAEEIVFLCPRQISLPTSAGDVVSLFPLAAVSGASEGLKWPIDGLAFDPARFIGTSNEAIGPVTLTMNDPAMIVILPRAYLGVVTQALASQPPGARWTVRAGQYTAPPQS
ncbi:MAG: thiamine diphosphokinase [Pseudomonadota bacterium]